MSENSEHWKKGSNLLWKSFLWLFPCLLTVFFFAAWHLNGWRPERDYPLNKLTSVYGDFTRKVGSGGPKTASYSRRGNRLEAMPYLAYALRDAGYEYWEDYLKTCFPSECPRRSEDAGRIPDEVRSMVCHLFTRAAWRIGLSQDRIDECLALIKLESGFNPDARNGTSSAYGLGQGLLSIGKGGRRQGREADFERSDAWPKKGDPFLEAEDPFLKQCHFVVWCYRDLERLITDFPRVDRSGERLRRVHLIYSIHHDGQNAYNGTRGREAIRVLKSRGLGYGRRDTSNVWYYTLQARQCRLTLGRSFHWEERHKFLTYFAELF